MTDTRLRIWRHDSDLLDDKPDSVLLGIASSRLGCWGPVVQCNVPNRGWMAGLGGCPNVGGVCIGCTMPGFPD